MEAAQKKTPQRNRRLSSQSDNWTTVGIIELLSTRSDTSCPSRNVSLMNADINGTCKQAVHPRPILSSSTKTRSRSLRTRFALFRSFN
jgi:hypothetical protein